MISVTDSFFEFKREVSNPKVKLSFEWLRENCRCNICYNNITNQRNIRIIDIDPSIQPLNFSTCGKEFVVNWSDGHKSVYDLEWITSQTKVESGPQEVLWSGDVSREVEHVTANEVKSQHGISRLVKSLLRFGVGFVTDVEPSVAATEEVIRHVGPPQHTLFGAMWEFSDQMDHLDTAYTNLALDPHTDTCYFIEPAGLIIFHCIKRNCSGGQTILVDGFRAARQVEVEHPQHYECLKTVHTEYQYIEKGYHLSQMSPVISHWPEGKIKQIRYNLYDRSARQVQPSSETSQFYKSLRSLTSAVVNPADQWRLTLVPGTVVFINNWRVLHGRSAYTGARTITGAYVTMGNLLSRARLLRLLL
ncbi:trimethyllysine dioxygenase, mitochondrial-like [Macrosteles quadrilineatus]|uniref:trimethyllysine dioxygenase, mitochondrial-like n=1 Tax=Macrosteles quadrilineatus TaxID=74068 RepID=UPI0023E109EE|nr:trimethyllysine dioxygenase, mitochondrial-like [Macrosteles quadrilineatus]